MRRLRRCVLALSALALGAAFTAPAAAEEAASPKSARASSLVLEVQGLGGGAALTLRATDESTLRVSDVVDIPAVASGLALRLGWDVSSGVQLGWTGSITKYWRAGALHVKNEETFGDEFFQFDDSPSLWSPLGGYLELQARDIGAFLGLGVALGYVPPVSRPRPGTIDAPLYVAGFSAEVGYTHRSLQRHAVSVFLRYAGWGGGESPFYTDYPEGLSLAELSLGVRWAFRP